MSEGEKPEVDTSKLSEENIRNFNKEDDTKDGKKWVRCEMESARLRQCNSSSYQTFMISQLAKN